MNNIKKILVQIGGNNLINAAISDENLTKPNILIVHIEDLRGKNIAAPLPTELNPEFNMK